MSDTTQPTIQPTTWRDVMLRMQQVGARSQCAVITITVMVENGQPAHWDEPTVVKVEPGRLAREFVRRVVGLDGSFP